MSRQKGSFGLGKILLGLHNSRKTSEMAGKSKYFPHQSEREMARRLRQLQTKLERRRGELVQ